MITFSSGKAQAEHPHLPPRPQPTLKPEDFADDNGDKIGARIVMYIIPSVVRPWTGVQWTDGAGNWHDVEGWQGAFNHPNHISWFVEQKDFGKGPFRWVVYTSQGGALLAVSSLFYLPINANETVRVEAILPDVATGYQASSPTQIVPDQIYEGTP